VSKYSWLYFTAKTKTTHQQSSNIKALASRHSTDAYPSNRVILSIAKNLGFMQEVKFWILRYAQNDGVYKINETSTNRGTSTPLT
jgi:hypothetical protein